MGVSKKVLYSALMIAVSVISALLVGEVILRAVAEDKYYVWPPNLERTFRPTPGTMPGISGDSRFMINDSGMRGRPFSENDRFRILTIGGSTTECLYLDQSESWPQLLEDRLNSVTELPVWVGNVGKSGRNTRAHVLQVEKLLDQHSQIDLLVLLIGINDLALRLILDIEWRPMKAENQTSYHYKVLHRAFSVYPLDRFDPFSFDYKRTGIWRLLRQVKSRIVRPVRDARFEDDVGSGYVVRRERRQRAAKMVDTLPDMTPALEEYAENISQIINLARERRTQLVFMTQPSMWRRDLPDSLTKLLWYGRIGEPKEATSIPYYSVEALAAAMKMYNETLLEVCKTKKANCLDLSELVPKDTNAFYDDVHFNEQGAEIVADALSRYLRQIEIFEPRSSQ